MARDEIGSCRSDKASIERQEAKKKPKDINETEAEVKDVAAGAFRRAGECSSFEVGGDFPFRWPWRTAQRTWPTVPSQ